MSGPLMCGFVGGGGGGNVSTAVPVPTEDQYAKSYDKTQPNNPFLVEDNFQLPTFRLSIQPDFITLTPSGFALAGTYTDENFPDALLEFLWDRDNNQWALRNAGTGETFAIDCINHSIVDGNTISGEYQQYTLGLGETKYLTDEGALDLNFNLATDGDQLLSDSTFTFRISAAGQDQTGSVGVRAMRINNIDDKTLWLRWDFEDGNSNVFKDTKPKIIRKLEMEMKLPLLAAEESDSEEALLPIKRLKIVKKLEIPE